MAHSRPQSTHPAPTGISYRLRIDSLSRETIRIKIKSSSFNYRKVSLPTPPTYIENSLGLEITPQSVVCHNLFVRNAWTSSWLSFSSFFSIWSTYFTLMTKLVYRVTFYLLSFWLFFHITWKNENKIRNSIWFERKHVYFLKNNVQEMAFILSWRCRYHTVFYYSGF